MLFYIDKTVAEKIESKQLTDDECYFFGDLARTCQRGDCFLSGDVDSLSKLANYPKLPYNSFFHVILDKRAGHRAIMQNVLTVFVLSFANELGSVKIPNFLKEEMNYKFLSITDCISNSYRLNQQCCLLAENLEDEDFYSLIAKRYVVEHDINGINISFHREHGGGDPICKVLKKCVSEDKVPTLCIIDSDQKYGKTNRFKSNPGFGCTLNNVLKIKKELEKNSNMPPFYVNPLKVHEVENLIPLQALSDIGNKDSSLKKVMEPGLKILNSLAEIENGEPILYYDFKNGFPYIGSEPQREYWLGIIKSLGGEEKDLPPCTKTNLNDHIFFPPVCKNKLLERAVKTIEATNLKVDNWLAKYWDEVGLLMITWGCASIPISA